MSQGLQCSRMMCLLAAVKTLRAVLSRLNEAPRSVLLSMPGVGPKRADRILALSRRNERNKGTRTYVPRRTGIHSSYKSLRKNVFTTIVASCFLNGQSLMHTKPMHAVFLKEALTAKALSPSLLARLTGDDNIPVLIKYAQLYRQCFHDNCQVRRFVL